MVNTYNLLKDNIIFRFFRFQLSNCIYQEKPFQKPYIYSLAKSMPCQKAFILSAKHKTFFLVLILNLLQMWGNSFMAMDFIHGDTDLCQMIHAYLANNQIFCLFGLMNSCPLPPSRKPTGTGQFIMLLIFFNRYLKQMKHMRDEIQTI